MLRIAVTFGFAAVISNHLAAQVVFEVASIKISPPQPPGVTSSRMSVDTGRLNYTNVTLKDVVGQAFKVQAYQISGPDWIETERFDIAAKIPPGAARDQVPMMLQSLLAERFHLSIHREAKELPIYALDIAKNGPKLKAAESENGITSNSNRTSWHLAAKVAMRRFAEFLSERMGRPVLDQTGLKGSFEFMLDWAPDDVSAPNDGPAGPSIFTALQEQLGLKLRSTTGPVEMIIVDHSDKEPSDN
jgi:uncharacterized protein (TIGR03435 family)